MWFLSVSPNLLYKFQKTLKEKSISYDFFALRRTANLEDIIIL